MKPIRLVRLRQKFDTSEVADPSQALSEQLTRLDSVIRPGTRVAIAVGSRGISNLSAFVKAVAAFVSGKGARPFIVPAMGSHGGATADGQREILRLYGISEETVGVPVLASMDVVELPHAALPHRLFMDRNAYESDAVILINRIMPHTDYHGKYESGLMKMALIGLGKLEGALAMHAFGIRGLRDMLGPAATQVLAAGKIVAGIGLVENALHKTMIVKVLKADEIPAEEPALLAAATKAMPRLPVDAIDVLVIDRMGKNISGVGIDTNIIGRIGVRGQADPDSPRIKAIMVTDLTDESHGNAVGLGLADVVTRKLYDKIDRRETYRNTITSGFMERGKIPLVADTDREAFDIALRSCGHVPEGQERIVRLLDTLSLQEMYVSKVIAGELEGAPRIEVGRTDTNLFDELGTLSTF
jgi:hypothetical protein